MGPRVRIELTISRYKGGVMIHLTNREYVVVLPGLEPGLVRS
jgi:hypothetical protein